MDKWEADLNNTFSESQWKQVIQWTYNVTHCITHWELAPQKY